MLIIYAQPRDNTGSSLTPRKRWRTIPLCEWQFSLVRYETRTFKRSRNCTGRNKCHCHLCKNFYSYFLHFYLRIDLAFLKAIVVVSECIRLGRSVHICVWVSQPLTMLRTARSLLFFLKNYDKMHESTGDAPKEKHKADSWRQTMLLRCIARKTQKWYRERYRLLLFYQLFFSYRNCKNYNICSHFIFSL